MYWGEMGIPWAKLVCSWRELAGNTITKFIQIIYTVQLNSHWTNQNHAKPLKITYIVSMHVRTMVYYTIHYTLNSWRDARILEQDE